MLPQTAQFTLSNIWASIKYIQKSEESTIIRFEQEKAQKRFTCPRRATSVINGNVLIEAKQQHLNGLLGPDDYQKQLRSFSYRYINIFDKADKDDLDYEPNNS